MKNKLIILVIVALVLGGTIYWLNNKADTDWKSYTNKELGFSVSYPAELGGPIELSTANGRGIGIGSGGTAYIIFSIGKTRIYPDNNTTQVTVDGRVGKMYQSSQVGSIISIPLGDGSYFNIEGLTPNIPADKSVLDTIKFIK